MTKIILHGYAGKMGQTLARMIGARGDMQVVGGIDVGLAGRETDSDDSGVALCSVPEQFVGEADVIIDFSFHAAVPPLLDFARKRCIPAVVATTGLTQEEMGALTDAAKEVAIFRSANMSLGINLLAKALKGMTPFLERDFDIEIVEMHHNMKKDAPSGTALLLADKINEACEEKKEYIYGRHGDDQVFDHGQIGIHALRGGTIPGEHTVRFAGPDEVIELKHLAFSRDVFAHGALAAAEFLAGKPAGLYSMDDLIG